MSALPHPGAIVAPKPYDITIHTTHYDRTTDKARWLLTGYWTLLAFACFWNSLDKNNFVPGGVLPMETFLHGLGFAGLFWCMAKVRLAGRLAPMNQNAAIALVVAGVFGIVEQYLQPMMHMHRCDFNLTANLLGVAVAFVYYVTPIGKVRQPAAVTWLVRVLLVATALPLGWLATTSLGHRAMAKAARLTSQPQMFDDYCHFAGAAVMLALLLLACSLSRRFGRASVAVCFTIAIAAAPVLELY